MTTPDFPTNNISGKPPRNKVAREDVSENRKDEPRVVKRVATGKVIRRKKKQSPLMDAFNETITYVMQDIVKPRAKELLADTISQGSEKLIFHDNRGSASRARSRTASNGGSYISYNRYSSAGSQGRSRANTNEPRQISRESRARHDFDDIILEDRATANEVLDGLFELISVYGYATVADLYESVGAKPEHTDEDWGWYDLRSSSTRRIRQGFILDLPRPEFLE